ncbi:MAG: M56 family metallopeptidase [Verrucomicrobiae bacterium]|nr:M56 family metallopeptidase [Verrucomicrobiae bacterium]
MNDFTIPVILAEFLVKSGVVLAIGFGVLAAISRVLPAEVMHSLWLRIFSVSLVIPVLLVAVPRWKVLPDLFTLPPTETPVLEMPSKPVTYTTGYTPVSDVAVPIVPAADPGFEFSWPWTLFAIWVGGVAWLLLRSVSGGMFLRRIERGAEPASGKILAKFNELNDSPRRNRITLLLSPLVKSPFTWGLVRSRIALPESAANWSDDDLEMILLHELEHVRRNDARAVLVSRLFLALNWVNPFAWIAIDWAAQHREEACDWRVIDAGFSSENYAAMLFRQAKISVSPIPRNCATAVAETGTIENRVKMILNESPRILSGKVTLLSRLSGIATLLAVLAIGISGFSDNEAIAADVAEPSNPGTPADEGIAAIEQKLKNISIPSVEFSKTPLRNALAFLQQKSVDLDATEPDPARKGIDIILDADAAGDTPITLRMTKVPLIEALRYTTELADSKYKVEPKAVVILPLTSPTAELYTNVFQVSPTFMNIGGHDAKTALEVLTHAGVTFPQGGSAIYNRETSQLIVRNTEDQIELIEALLDSGSDQAAAMDPEVEAYLRRIESITLPSVELVDAPIMDAAAFFQRRSVELDVDEPDPAKKGINIVVASGGIRDAVVNLKLTDVPLGEALRYTAELAGGGLRVDESAVVIGYDKSTPRSPGGLAAAKAKIEANEKKLTSIVIPHLEFVETALPDALEFLQQRSVDLDINEPDTSKKGLNFVLDTGRPKKREASAGDPLAGGGFDSGSGGDTREPTIDLKLSNITLAAALKYTCDLAGMEYIVEPHNILIHPKP